MAAMTEYLWIAVVGTIFGFIYAFGIGANDVANAFATTVASKSITLGQAVIIASIFEFCGAMFLGASVTGTVRGKIFDTAVYEDEPEIVMLGMFTSLIAASFMLLVATHYAMPVSTTHTVVGCIIGFTSAAKGFSSINWGEVKNIFISWIAAPLVTGAFAFVIFGALRYFVLMSADPFKRGYYSFSFILTGAIGLDIFFIFNKGTKNFEHFQKEVYNNAWVVPTSFGIGALFGLLWLWPVGPKAKKVLEARKVKREEQRAALAAANAKASTHTALMGDESEKVKVDRQDGEGDDEKQNVKFEDQEGGAAIEEALESQDVVISKSTAVVKKSMSTRFAEKTYKQDLQTQSFRESERAKQVWDDAVQYDEEVEQLFTFVQVFTASMNSFAHGANDIANAIAPVAAIIDIYQTGVLNSKAPVQKWILAYGGVALVLGLLIYGYKVMKTIGYKLTALSPTRGATAELSASLMVSTASFMGIPVSTTQCIVGGVAGVGLVEGPKNVQWLQLAKVCVSWVCVFFVACVISAGIFSFCAYSPSLTS